MIKAQYLFYRGIGLYSFYVVVIDKQKFQDYKKLSSKLNSNEYLLLICLNNKIAFNHAFILLNIYLNAL